jgi:NDP-sugar pyrophosphorylase family protein
MTIGCVLAGGQGSRLKEVTSTGQKYGLSKAAVPLGDRRLVDYPLGAVKRAGIQDVWVHTCWLPETISRYVGDGRVYGLNVEFLRDDQLPGTYGVVMQTAKASHLSKDGEVAVMCGDIVHNLDLAPLIEAHRKNGAAMTMVVNPVWEVALIERFGTAQLEGVSCPSQFSSIEEYLAYIRGFVQTNGGKTVRVEGFAEKEPCGKAMSILNDSSIYVISGRVIQDYQPSNACPDLNRDFIPWLIRHSESYPLYAFVMPFRQGTRDIYWRDVGTQYFLWEANMDRLEGKIEGPLESPQAARVKMAKSATVEGSILGDRVRVGKGAVIRKSVIGEGAVIESGTEIVESVVFPQHYSEDGPNRIGRKSSLRRTLFLGGWTAVAIEAFQEVVFTSANGEIQQHPIEGF